MSEQVQYATATIQFSRKNGMPNYSNEEFGTFLQVPLVNDEGQPLTDAKQVEALLDEQTAFLKAWVYKQLGTAFDVDAQTGVVFGEVPIEQPKAKKAWGGKGGTTTAKKAPSADKETLWATLASAAKHSDGTNFKSDDGETIWDNRVGKRNPKGPDFKFADSGEGLWLSDAPDWFVGPGEGL